MRITNVTSVGITIRFSWREVTLLMNCLKVANGRITGRKESGFIAALSGVIRDLDSTKGTNH